MASRPKMTWEKSPAALVDLFEKLAPKDAQVEQKKMFGWPCCFVNGNLFAGLHKQSMIFRLAEQDQAAFLEMDDAAEFEPMPGRKNEGIRDSWKAVDAGHQRAGEVDGPIVPTRKIAAGEGQNEGDEEARNEEVGFRRDSDGGRD
jgi:hypothetical protein